MDIRINLVGYFKKKLNDFIQANVTDLSCFKLDIHERYYETTLEIKCLDIYKNEFDELVRKTTTTYRNYVYGINEDNIYSAVFKLLKVNKMRLSIAESVSGGRLSSEFVSNNEGASSVLIESLVCYTRESKENRLNIPKNIFDENSTESVAASYELANGLLKTSRADVVIATTGYTNNCGEGNDGKCFLAVGNREQIHIFKHKFSGTRNNIMQQISKVAFLHLLKIVKENLYNYEQNVV